VGEDGWGVEFGGEGEVGDSRGGVSWGCADGFARGYGGEMVVTLSANFWIMVARLWCIGT
jgi:hypothetical protein